MAKSQPKRDLDWRRWLSVAGAVTAIAASVATVHQACPRTPDDHRISVIVVDPDGHKNPDGVVLSSSPEGILKRVPGGWEIELQSRGGAGGRIQIDARLDAASLTGSTTVPLDSAEVSATVLLTRRDVDVSGRVQDEAERPLPGTTVAVVGHEAERVVTDRFGAFSLPAHTAHLQAVRVRAWRDGYEAREEWVYAGGLPAVIVLSRRP